MCGPFTIPLARRYSLRFTFGVGMGGASMKTEF